MKTYVHIGLIKTGSTFLQKTVFPRFGEINGRLYIGATVNLHQHNILSKNFSHILISNENIAGHPLNYPEDVAWLQQFKNSINNVKELYNDPYIIIGFREPSSMVQSVYKQSLNEWGVKSWKQYINEASDTYLEQFEFSEYVKVLLDNFEREKLFIYDHRDLLGSSEMLLNRLNTFLDIPIKSSDAASALRIKENVSVPINLENTLLILNRMSFFLHKYVGFRLAFKLGSLRINPVIICKMLVYFSKKPANNRDLGSLKSRFKKDWLHTQQLIKSIQ